MATARLKAILSRFEEKKDSHYDPRSLCVPVAKGRRTTSLILDLHKIAEAVPFHAAYSAADSCGGQDLWALLARCSRRCRTRGGADVTTSGNSNAAAPFQIARSQSVADVEAELARMAADRRSSLQLPQRIEHSSIGGEAALVQLVVTWAKRFPRGGLVTYIDSEGDEQTRQIRKLVRKSYGFVAALMAGEVFDRQGDAISKPVYAEASSWVDEMNQRPRGAQWGNRALLACVDHSSKWQLRPFYAADGLIRSRLEFRELGKVLIAGHDDPKLRKHIAEEHYEGLGRILYELVKNTHDWGRHKLGGALLERSVRGIMVKTGAETHEAAEQAVEGAPPLQAFVRHAPFQSDDGRMRWMEISVFDSGPGLAARWLKRPIDESVKLDDEFRACMDCLAKHASSSGVPYAGMGLYNVVRTLSPLQGFLRVRTGRLSLYRDFVERPMQEEEKIRVADLDDWTNRGAELRMKPSVEGTLLTILIPLGAR